MKTKDRLNELIEMGKKVLSTRRPPPYDEEIIVIGPDTVDESLFNRWKRHALLLLQSQFGDDNLYFREFQQKCESNLPSCVDEGLSILQEIIVDVESGVAPARKISEENKVSISIDRSTVGMLSTGKIENVRSINTNISTLASSDQSQVAEALKNLTEAVAESKEITSEQKDETLEQLELLSEQAVLPAPERKTGLIKPTLSALATILSSAGGLAEVWSTWGTPIKAFFGVGG